MDNPQGLKRLPSNDDANSFLMGGGTPWAKWPNIGDTVTGKVISEPVKQQQRDFDDFTELLYWPDGSPKWEIVFNIQTAERDPEIDADDGVRAMHVKGYMHPAVKEAVKASGADGIHIGGTISVTYTADGERKGGGRGKPPKLYSARYTPPASAGNTALMGNGDRPAPGRPAAPAGVDTALWAAMSPEQQDTYLAAIAARDQPVGATPGVEPPF